MGQEFEFTAPTEAVLDGLDKIYDKAHSDGLISAQSTKSLKIHTSMRNQAILAGANISEIAACTDKPSKVDTTEAERSDKMDMRHPDDDVHLSKLFANVFVPFHRGVSLRVRDEYPLLQSRHALCPLRQLFVDFGSRLQLLKVLYDRRSVSRET